MCMIIHRKIIINVEYTMTAMQEIELKFLVPDNKLTAIKRQTHIKSAVSTQLSAHYFDTAEQSLARSGTAIRIRQEMNDKKDDWVQTLKINGDGLASRLEHNHLLDSETAKNDHANGHLMPDLSIYKNTPIETALATAEQLTLTKKKPLNGEMLNLLYSTDVHRTTRLLEKIDNNKPQVIEVAFDTGLVTSMDKETGTKLSQPIQEVEFELLQGQTEYLFEMAKVWCKRYNLCLSTITKAERGSLVMANKTHPRAVKSNLKPLTKTLNKKTTQEEFIRIVVHNCLMQIMPNASAIVAGSVGDSECAGEHVHQLRVGIRRLRTALKFFVEFSDDINPEWQNNLKKTFIQLGEYRDYDILLSKTQPALETIGAPAINWLSVDKSIKTMPLDAVSSNDLQLTLLELIQFTLSEPKSETSQKFAKPMVRKILDKLFNKVVKVSDNFANINIEAQHDVRKRLKALRYLSEFGAPLFDGTDNHKKLTKKNKNKNKAAKHQQKTAKRFIKYLEPAQSVLGDYNDNIVAHEFYVQKSIIEPKAYFAVGWFLAREKQSVDRCAEILTELKNAPKFW